MELDDILKFVDIEDQRLRQKYGNYPDEEKRALARTAKLNEEVGELCGEVLSHNGTQRVEKLDQHDNYKLSDEFVDVIISALLLTKSLDINVGLAIEKCIKKVNSRY